MRISLVARVALFMAAVASASTIKSRATVCNGHAEFCAKTYSSVSVVGAHDSYAVGTSSPAVNQDYDVTQQLTDGIRLLQVQAHNNSGVLTLCHTSCSLYKGDTLEVYLGKVKTWLDANPNEVVSVLIVNIDNELASAFDTVYKAASVDTISYAPTKETLTYSEWPTLGSMIDAGTRLVTFLDNAADFATAPYLIDEFTNIWEDAFDVLTTDFPCTVNRTKSDDTANQMYLVNHFLDTLVLNIPIPDIANANKTNAASGIGSLGEQVKTCTALHTKAPTFMLVDFYEYGGGSVFQVAADINGVTYSPTTPVPSPKASTTSTSPTSTSTSTSNKNGGVLSHFGSMELFWTFAGIAIGATMCA